ncbi:Type 1 glutamine amidotransferase-like domain-containing protein [Rossellomorea aquimaris]|uniref:Type 1 glutamine amidotransferase-like domain-containing protein n=1 Tax=Rossellomorea aquimaris TaxID=189382 RepID=UPI001CD3E534|nr:Type 1 glutamine amidotransferase-like domain-containing protein [Rossellomorea aquimaris]MCA1054016.1 Type 1 glutamine amidotransferase-like domain-containing protein [Rossellomorea aquimaris]
MGELYFYSDQIAESPGNRRLDDRLFANKQPESMKIGYLPSTEDPERLYFKQKESYYQQYGVTDLLFFDLYSDFDASKMEELLNCDVIHLSAGNPLYFRRALRNRAMVEPLRHYYVNGGTIVGVSGGAVQLGKTAKLFELFIGDEGQDRLDTLDLADFEFLPHYNRWDEKYKRAVVQHARASKTKVLAGSDGDGVIIDSDGVHFIGDIVEILD